MNIKNAFVNLFKKPTNVYNRDIYIFLAFVGIMMFIGGILETSREDGVRFLSIPIGLSMIFKSISMIMINKRKLISYFFHILWFIGFITTIVLFLFNLDRIIGIFRFNS